MSNPLYWIEELTLRGYVRRHDGYGFSHWMDAWTDLQNYKNRHPTKDFRIGSNIGATLPEPQNPEHG